MRYHYASHLEQSGFDRFFYAMDLSSSFVPLAVHVLIESDLAHEPSGAGGARHPFLGLLLNHLTKDRTGWAFPCLRDPTLVGLFQHVCRPDLGGNDYVAELTEGFSPSELNGIDVRLCSKVERIVMGHLESDVALEAKLPEVVTEGATVLEARGSCDEIGA